MHKQIMEHIRLFEAIKKTHLPFEVLKYDSNQKVLQLCEKIIELQLETVVPRITNAIWEYLLLDLDFMDKISIFLKEEIAIERINSLISGAGTEQLSRYDIDTLEETLTDESLDNGTLFAYLKFYHRYCLSETQKIYLNNGLYFLRKYTEMQLNLLSEENLKLFWEPIFSCQLLKKVTVDQKTLQDLTRPGFLLLLNDLQEHMHSYFALEKTHWEQLKEEPETIRKQLNNLLSYLDQADIPSFLEMWMENNTLLYDIKKLNHIIPQKTADERHRLSHNRTAYISTLYGGSIEGVPLEGLMQDKTKLLIYAITHKKKHFLSLVREYFNDFMYLPKYSILFDPDIYQTYMNINTLNEKNFQKCFSIMRMGEDIKPLMVSPPYLFSELEILSGLSEVYVKLFHKLEYVKSDDRLRVFREISKKRCLPEKLEEREIEVLGKMLSQKALSQWMQKEFSHINGLYPEDAICMLSNWEQVERFVSEMDQGVQVRFLLKNIDKLDKFAKFQEIYVRILEMEPFWKELCKEFNFTEEFITENKDNIPNFLYEGGAEIMYTFLMQQPDKKEQIRRILTAELMGRFKELKYHADDLQKEIDFPITEIVSRNWQENTGVTENGFRLWEEDRLLPVMQIGEIPEHTCMSYKSGAYNECLLSNFDSNKKIMQASIDGKIVFRAILRLTKGCFVRNKAESTDIEFADLTKQPNTEQQKKQEEELVLFLERPYFRCMSGDKKNKLTESLFRLLQKKAKTLGARLVVSTSYTDNGISMENLVLSHYYIYISASKNGSQYLDSGRTMMCLKQCTE